MTAPFLSMKRGFPMEAREEMSEVQQQESPGTLYLSATPIGNLVHWFIKEKHIKKKDVAESLGVSGITLNSYFKQKSLQTVILWRIGKAINYNFFAFLAERMNIPYETQCEKDLKAQLENLQRENRDLKRENDLMKDILKR